MRDFSADHRWLSLNTATVRGQGDLVTIIEKAAVSEEAGWIQLALKGEPEEIQRAVADLNTIGVFVSPAELAVLG